jgi:hypothetical protein
MNSKKYKAAALGRKLNTAMSDEARIVPDPRSTNNMRGWTRYGRKSTNSNDNVW